MFDTLRALLAKRLLPKGTQGRRIIPNVDIWDGSSPTSEIGDPARDRDGRDRPDSSVSVPEEARQKPAGGAPHNASWWRWQLENLCLEYENPKWQGEHIDTLVGEILEILRTIETLRRLTDSAVPSPEEPIYIELASNLPDCAVCAWRWGAYHMGGAVPAVITVTAAEDTEIEEVDEPRDTTISDNVVNP
jgi:hypothetical protein